MHTCAGHNNNAKSLPALVTTHSRHERTQVILAQLWRAEAPASERPATNRQALRGAHVHSDAGESVAACKVSVDTGTAVSVCRQTFAARDGHIIVVANLYTEMQCRMPELVRACAEFTDPSCASTAPLPQRLSALACAMKRCACSTAKASCGQVLVSCAVCTCLKNSMSKRSRRTFLPNERGAPCLCTTKLHEPARSANTSGRHSLCWVRRSSCHLSDTCSHSSPDRCRCIRAGLWLRGLAQMGWCSVSCACRHRDGCCHGAAAPDPDGIASALTSTSTSVLAREARDPR